MKVLALLAFAAVLLVCTSASNMCRTKEPCSVTYKTIGCYRDSISDRVLPNYIYNERDSTISNYGGRKIEWHNWNNYIAEFSCRCAKKAKELGYDLFGVQFYGECWAGKSGTHTYSRLGASEDCLGDNYKACTSTDRYCAGKHETNFVYEIIDNTCSLDIEQVGCYKDAHVDGARPLGNYVLSDRDTTVSVYSGQSIDWRNYDVYLPDLICRCAKKAKENNGEYFGLQFYGECWTHPNGGNTFARDHAGDNCVDGCFKECGGKKYCTGQQFRNYVYRIKDSSNQGCDVSLQSMGCYNEVVNDRALGNEIKNIIPDSKLFYGEQYTKGDWNSFFPGFLCACSRAARARSFTYFGVSDYGDCYGGNSGYDKHGSSSSCSEGLVSNATCSQGSTLCAGSEKTSMYVYKVLSEKRSIADDAQLPVELDKVLGKRNQKRMAKGVLRDF